MTTAQKPDALEVVAYLRATKDGQPVWDGDDCVCQDPVYPSDPDGSDAGCISMPMVRLTDAQASLLSKEAEKDAEIVRLKVDAARWRTFERIQGHGLPGPVYRRHIRVVEICPMYGEEKEITDLRAAIDAARAAANQGGA
ncbi:hypothetical protein [Variovorax sp. DXTD-1]|uniref:hypothetical protein n=1 Tax=Variovorax sp. DXTD-1 TaxID=2495592 RepID=UPI000F8703F0|nr:hypothetical protein [Variovorax sp. DXTD-1]RST54140.1 hypothetical protein EJI00_03160 [Variovorax sp. DXTD-1]